MKLSFRTIGKFGFLLVIIGFFMPVACDMNGLQIADFMMGNDMVLDGLLTYILLISAIAGLAIGLLSLMKTKISVTIDWIILLVCILSGLIVYFSNLDGLKLQSGAYFILIGWIVALIPQIVSKIKKET